MLKAEQQRVLSELVDGIKRSSSASAAGIMRAPVTDFTCPELLAKEKIAFFRQAPLLLGLSSDLPARNTYLATSEIGVPLLLTRDAEGQFRAFLNVCKHRGVQVVVDGRGTSDRFACPFHAWTYRNNGDLIAINRESKFGDVNKNNFGLTQVPAAEKHGMLWVRPTPGEPVDVDQRLGGLAAEMAAWQLPLHPFSENQVLEADINWKLAIDTFGENYHFDVLHRETLAPEIYGNLQTHDVYADNYRMVFASKPGFKYVSDKGLAQIDWPYRWVTLNVYFIFPNVILLVDAAGVDILRMYPAGNDPTRSRTHHSYYMNPEMEAQLRAAGNAEPIESRFPGFNHIIVDEDYAVASSTQRNATSGAQTHYLFGRNEPALHHYHNAHRRGLGLEPLRIES